jgi:hypothetical protein
VSSHNQSIPWLYWEKCWSQSQYTLWQICINCVSTIFGLASCIIIGLSNGINLPWDNRLSWWAKILVKILWPPPENEYQQSINGFYEGSVYCIVTNCTGWCQHEVVNDLSSLYVPVFNFTIIPAMAHRFKFCHVWNSEVNISEPACYFTITSIFTATQVKFPNFQFPTAISDSTSCSISSLQSIISSKNDPVFIHDLSDLTFQIICNTVRASMRVGSKRPIVWNNSRCESL